MILASMVMLRAQNPPPVPTVVSCFLKNQFTAVMVNCSTLVVTGNSQVADGQHHWNFGDGNGWHFYANTQETVTLCNGTHVIQHFVEKGTLLCEVTVQVNCGGFTITENTDPCYKDFACFKFETNYCPGTILTWDFDDGTMPITCDCQEIEYCYTNVNTFTGVNTVVMPSVTENGQTSTNTLDITDYDVGIFIGVQGQVSNLTNYSLVLPNPNHNGNVSGEPVYVYGTVNVNKTFTFTDTDVIVERSGGFNVKTNFTFTTQTNTVISSAHDCPCLWRGIDVQSSATLLANPGTTLQEALYAVRAMRSGGNPNIGLRGVSFMDNYIGLVAAPPGGSLGNGNFSFDGLSFGTGFSGNTFASAQVKDWCGGGNNVPNAFGPSGGLFTNDRGWAGVYLERVTNFQVPTAVNATNHFINERKGLANAEINRTLTET